ncbi:uncharacterized protein LOC120336417 [Styela clava]|uniref:pro-neuregulin-1, membrane-bound isoform-like n=1 Tax=Styela clava TaxID=7725 RepID=UPI00193ADC89|nr:pro-neuregulin-1, membrane-bound isoform-like [Styela clava]XP_039260026.1 pro-neuregulin-1, membrane-bound isoform-like [Styela clava]XP_039260027.1 pro-neuregulin-1, membrane-bound isoform-like [Styela clava]
MDRADANVGSTTTQETLNTTAAAGCGCLYGGKCRRTGSTLEVSCLCPKGYEGKRCQKSVIEFNTSPKQLENQELVAGCVVAGFIVLILAIVGIIVWRRYRKIQKNKKRRTSLQESYKKKMSIEGISIIDEKSSNVNKCPYKCHPLGSTPPPSYIEVAGKNVSGNVYVNPAAVPTVYTQPKPEVDVSTKCHDNPLVTVKDESKNTE